MIDKTLSKNFEKYFKIFIKYFKTSNFQTFLFLIKQQIYDVPFSF